MKSLGKAIKQTKPFNSAYHKASINLIYTGKWIVKMHNDVFVTYGLSLQQYNILRILRGCHPKVATVKYIKARMLDKMSDASRIVDNMVKKELIIRNHSADDRRKVDITLSEKGMELLVAIDKKTDEMDEFISNLTVEEAEQLSYLLDKARSK